MCEKKRRNAETTHKIMASIPSKNTKPELILRKALWHKGFRYRKNDSSLPGKPDIVFSKYKIAVFIDGDFWHGHNWKLRGLQSFEDELKNYSDYWRTKLINNVNRDILVNMQLSDLGWTVIRIWESEIKTDVDECCDRIISVYRKKQSA